MAQSGYTPILLYGSNTASSVPSASNLTSSTSGVELALNYTDGKLYYKDNSGVVQLLASKAAAAGVLSFSAGSTGLTPSTATSGAVTLAGTLGISNGGTGITSFGTGVQTALGVNVGTAGSFLVNGGVLGTPSSGTVTNLTGTASININGTVGATTPSTGAFTTLSGTGQLTLTNASNYNLYASGAGANYFAGNVGIGTTTMSQAFNVTGVNASGFVGQRIQNYTGGSGIAGVEFSSDPTYAKAAIGLLREQLNGGGTLSLYNSSSTSAANWATTDARLQIGFTGAVSLAAPAGSESLRVTPVASAVNYWNFQGNVTGAGVQLFAQGSDANISAYYAVKGSGNHVFWDNLGSTQFVVARTASAVNYLQVSGGDGSTSSPTLQATGSSANVTLQMLSKGTGELQFFTNSGSKQFVVAHTASAVNYLQVTGSPTTGPVSLTAQGSDTNINLYLNGKGTGTLQFGTYTAGIIAQAGYITITDAAGTTRRLLVG